MTSNPDQSALRSCSIDSSTADSYRDVKVSSVIDATCPVYQSVDINDATNADIARKSKKSNFRSRTSVLSNRLEPDIICCQPAATEIDGNYEINSEVSRNSIYSSSELSDEPTETFPERLNKNIDFVLNSHPKSSGSKASAFSRVENRIESQHRPEESFCKPSDTTAVTSVSSCASNRVAGSNGTLQDSDCFISTPSTTPLNKSTSSKAADNSSVKTNADLSFSQIRAANKQFHSRIPGELCGYLSSLDESAEKSNSLPSSPHIKTREDVNKVDNIIQVKALRANNRTLRTVSSIHESNLEDPWVKPTTVRDSSTARVHFAASHAPDESVFNPELNTDMNDLNKYLNHVTTPDTYDHAPATRRTNSLEELEQIYRDGPRDPASFHQESNASELREIMRNDFELLSRPSWCDAKFALSRVEQGKAKGNRYCLKIRSFLHQFLFKVGCLIQRKASTVCFLGILILGACSVGLKGAQMETNIEKLWVESGGQLEEEAKYTRFATSTGGSSGDSGGYTLQLLIQTGEDVATNNSMLLHLKAAVAATEVTAVMYNQTWRFSDLCYKQSIPTTSEDGRIDFSKTLDLLWPCFIIGPLDCFWEGSKLLGPSHPVYLPTFPDVTWKTLDPQLLLDGSSAYTSNSLKNQVDTYRKLMAKAGVTTGYVTRSCLDPYDPECPKTAPNYHSKEFPDVKKLLSKGCSGFATNLMQWPIDLIVGGIKRGATSTITNARGLQTLFQLMSAGNMYEFYLGSIRTGNSWSISRAEEILAEWQRKFVNKMHSIKISPTDHLPPTTDTLYAFSVAATADILNEFSRISPVRLFGGYLLMMGYACISLMRTRASISQGAVGVLGVLLVALSVAAGLGICSVIGISFNAASVQVLPFLLLGLGVDDMFLMAHHFGQISVMNYIPFEERTGQCLKRVGVSVSLTSIAILSGFLFSLIIPMPALRAFGLQAAIVTVFNLISVLVIFPAILSIDLKRRKNNKLDLLCCFDSSNVNDVVDLNENNRKHLCSHGHLTHHHRAVPDHPIHNPSLLPGSNYQDRNETTITMHHTIQAYSNDSYLTVLGAPSGTTTPSHPPHRETEASTASSYGRTPRTPPPDYTVSESRRREELVTKPTPPRPKVAFANEAIVETPPTTGYSTPRNPRTYGRTSRRGTGSNPPTNLTTPMESVRSSTHSLVPRRRRGRRSGCCFGSVKRSGSFYACLATLPSLTISQLGERYYAPFLMKKKVKIVVIILFCVLLGVSIYGTTLVEDGLDLGDVLPKGTHEHAAIVAQSTYFSFYNMFVVTKNFDYASNQKNLYLLHETIGNFSYVMRNTDGNLTKFWLEYLREWLEDLQLSFDNDWTLGHVNTETWTPQASNETVLAFKLLRQTGRADEPTDKNRIGCTPEYDPCEKINRVRLVDEDGLIPEDAFYNYLSAWVVDDPLSYAAAQAQLSPSPTSWTPRRDANLIIPRSPAIIYAQMPFYLNGMRENKDFVNVIKGVRGICETFAAQTEVVSYPTGEPFTYWQQYIDLRFWLFISLGCVIGAAFIMLSLILFNPWASGIMALFLVMIATELLGFMGATNVKLSAVPAVILVASIGLGVEFTVHITLAYITSCGSREERLKQSIGHMFGPVIDGAISTLLGVAMLAGSEFNFIVIYFFQVLAVLLALGVLNGLFLLPVILSLIGPPPEVVPVGGGARLKTPTPPPTPPPEDVMCTCHSCVHSREFNSNINRNNRNNPCHCRRRSQYRQHQGHFPSNHCTTTADYNFPGRRARNCQGNSCAAHCQSRDLRCRQRGYGHHHNDVHPTSENNFGSVRPASERNTAWQPQGCVIPPSNRSEEENRVYLYPRAEYVFFSPGDSTPNERLHPGHHCETGTSQRPLHTTRHISGNMDRSTSASQGKRSKEETPGGEGSKKIATLTATSSLTVKVRASGRQPVVAFVEPSMSSSSNLGAFSPNNSSDLETWYHEQETLPGQVGVSRRRFDNSALPNQHHRTPNNYS